MNSFFRLFISLTIPVFAGCTSAPVHPFESERKVASSSESNELQNLVDAIQEFAQTKDFQHYSWFADSNLQSFLLSGGSLKAVTRAEDWQSMSRSMANQISGVRKFEFEFKDANSIPIKIKFRLFRNGLFEQAYFGNYWSEQYQKVTETQPWLEWDQQRNRIVPHRTGAQIALAKRLVANSSTGKISLFRGLTRPFEIYFFRSLSLMQKTDLTQNDRFVASQLWRQGIQTLKNDGSKVPYDSGLLNQVDTMALIIADNSVSPMLAIAKATRYLYSVQSRRPGVSTDWKDSISMSTSHKIAENFGTRISEKGSEKTIVSLELSTADFLSLASSGDLYVGIEDEPEVALISEKTHDLLFMAGRIDQN